MHREHDPNEWKDWTSRLFPVGQAAAPTMPGAEQTQGQADHHHHHHHHDDDPQEAARQREARRKLQNRLAQVIGLLILAEIVTWLFAPAAAFTGWKSPARWAAILGTIWSCHGVLENLVEGRIGADLALAQAALAALFLKEDFVAAEVVFISLVGEWLEDVAYQRARRAIGRLIDHAPDTARVWREGEWTQVPAGSVLVGDLVAVDAGEMVPVDGLVESGRSSVDASSLTGESLPVDVAAGDRVASGQINQFGRLEVRAQRVGMESTLGQVIRLMTKAQSKKAKLQRTADRYARYFLPAVETAALATLLAGFIMGWPDRWLRAVAVLVVACPCPLVLATPATILAAWATLARKGVLVKSGAALEQLAFCDTLAFDKTGTLTLGQPGLTRFEPLPVDSSEGVTLSPQEISALIVTVEQSNPHPLAGAITNGLAGEADKAWKLAESTTRPGAGVSGKVINKKNHKCYDVLIGNVRLMNDHDVPLNESTQEFLADCDAQGETPLLVAVNGQVLARLSLADPVRPEAHDMVHDLKHLGFTEVAILTGDRPGAAGRVGRKVHIKNVLSELSPTAKAGWIQDRLVAGRTVAMVGDGINDAPALAVARVGLAVSKVGANLATEAGDIILMHDPLRSLVRAREVSQAAVKILRQNILIFAFGVNGLAVLLAGLGVLSPVGAAVFHQIGSLAVLCNALRILAFDELKLDALTHRAEHWLEDADRAFGRVVQSLYGVIPGWRTITLAGLTILAIKFATSGIYSVQPDQVLVRFRQGRFLEVSGPGLVAGWPWPLEVSYRLEPRKWWNARLGQSLSEPVARKAAPGWATFSPETTPTDHWMTGDGQLVEMTVTLQARPDASAENLKRLVQHQSNALERVVAESESHLRQAVAGTRLDDLLSDKRHVLLEQTQDKVIRRMAEEGLQLSDLVLTVDRIQAPWPVLDSWRDSARAQREADRITIETLTIIELAEQEAKADIERMKADAETTAGRIQLQARSKAHAFRTMANARQGFPNLSDHRRFWTELGGILRDQPKVLLDAPAGDLYGTNAARRHLILNDSPGIPLNLAPDLATSIIKPTEPVGPPSAPPVKQGVRE